MTDIAATMSKSAVVSGLLKRRGLPSDIGSAIALLAGTIRDHRHLEQMLTSCSGEERQMLYDSVRPHLKFIPKPLDVYISSVSSKAEREKWPVMIDGKMTEFKPAQDVATVNKAIEKAIADRNLTLKCSHCTIKETFLGLEHETPVAVILKARHKGWVYNSVTSTEKCPKCAEMYA